MREIARALLAGCVVFAGSVIAARGDAPSRPALHGCAWEKIADAKLGLEAWVQRCDFGFRKIDFVFAGNSLAIRHSDGGAPDPLIDVIALEGNETPEAGVRRIFAARTPKEIARRCVLAPFRGTAARNGGKRFMFVPDAAYQKELDTKADPNDVGEPPCGDWGDSPDGIQYFEVQPGSRARKVLFVRVGQDEPLFDETSLKLLDAPRSQ
jgi:hypothetical protein